MGYPAYRYHLNSAAVCGRVSCSEVDKQKEEGTTMKLPQSLRDIVESAETLVYVEDLSSKKGIMQSINPIAKFVTIVSMIVTAIFITNLTYLLAICLVPLLLAVTSRIPLKHFFS